MAVAINKGMNDPSQNASTLVIAFCFIGNCTFPSYSIVGLCHSTHDISEQVRISGVNFEYSYIYGSRNITLDIGTGSSITLGLDIGLNKKVLQTTCDDRVPPYLPLSCDLVHARALFTCP